MRAKILRLLRTNRGFEATPSRGRESGHLAIPTSDYYGYQKEIETALLKAEHKKAEASMEWHRRRFIC